jgi:hypothetical protein
MTSIPFMQGFSVVRGIEDYEEVPAVKRKCGKLVKVYDKADGKDGLSGLDEGSEGVRG